MKLKFALILLISFPVFFASGQNRVVSSGPTFQDRFSKKLGNLRVSRSTVTLGRVKDNVTRIDTVFLYNGWSRNLTLSIAGKLPAWIKADLSSPELQPGKEGMLIVQTDLSKSNDYGFVLERVQLNTNDSLLSLKTFNITATVEEFFPVPGPTDTLQPKARLSGSVFDYGVIRQGDKPAGSIILYNDGKAPLKIHKAKTSCGCLNVTYVKDMVMPGDSSAIRLEFDSFGKEGKDSRKAYVYISDPVMPEIKLEVKGEVTK